MGHIAVTIIQLNCTCAQHVHRFGMQSKVERQNDARFRE